MTAEDVDKFVNHFTMVNQKKKETMDDFRRKMEQTLDVNDEYIFDISRPLGVSPEGRKSVYASQNQGIPIWKSILKQVDNDMPGRFGLFFFLAVLLYHNKIAGLNVLPKGPLRINFPESLFDGNSVPSKKPARFVSHSPYMLEGLRLRGDH